MAKSTKLDFNVDKLLIPIDTIQSQGNLSYNGVNFNKAADFIISINGKEKSQILVDAYYDSFQYIYGKKLEAIPQVKEYDVKNSGKFGPMYLCISRELYLPEDKVNLPLSKYETGKLQFGNGNPKSSDYNSLADFTIKGNVVEIRIPWQLLNVMDPSTKMVMDDLHIDGIKPIKIEGISAGVGVLEDKASAEKLEMNLYNLKEWETPIYHERLKPSYYILKDAFSKYK